VPGSRVRREAPAGGGFCEVGGVFILAEGGLGDDFVNVAAGGGEERFDVAAVFFVVDGGKLFPDGAVWDFLRDAFYDDGFVGLFCADGTVAVGGDVFGFAGVGAGAEPESFLPPDSPDQHEMRAAVGTSGGDPIVVGFFEALEGPDPRLKTLVGIFGHFGEVGPVGAAWFGLGHRVLHSRRVGEHDSIRSGNLSELIDSSSAASNLANGEASSLIALAGWMGFA
jgi:hypothetical protein